MGAMILPLRLRLAFVGGDIKVDAVDNAFYSNPYMHPVQGDSVIYINCLRSAALSAW